MKIGGILSAVGGMLLLLGIGFAMFAILPSDESHRLTIPAGNWYGYLSFGGLIDGSIEAHYAVANGGEIKLFIFDSDNYAEYEATGFASFLFTTSGSSGDFTFVTPDSGRYYIVIEHGFLSDAFDQDVTIDMTINGVSITGVVIGAVLISLGVATVFLGSRRKTMEAAASPPSPQTDVTIFQGRQQNPPGQA